MADKPPPPGFGDFEKQDEKPHRRSISADLMEDDLTDAKADLPPAPVASEGVVQPAESDDQPDLFLAAAPSPPAADVLFDDGTEHIDAGAKVEAAAVQGDPSPPSLEGDEKREGTKTQRDEEPTTGSSGVAPPNDSAADRFAGDGVEVRNSPPSLAEVASWRARAWDAGYRPVAVYGVKDGRCFCNRPTCKTPGKHPQGDGWEERARRNPPFAVEAAVNPKAPNTGTLADGLRAMDGDIDDPEIATLIRALAFKHFGPTIMRWRAGSSRFLLVYRAADWTPHKVTLTGKLGKIEMLGHGNQFVAHGMHASGARLQWTPEPLTEVPVKDLPAVTEEEIDAFFDAAAPLLFAERNKSNGSGPHATSSEGQRGDLFEVVRALEAIPNTGPANWDYFNKIGMATWAATNGAAAGFDVFCHWARKHESFDPAVCEERWQHYKTSPPTQIGAGTLIRFAREARSTERNPPPATREADYGVEGANAAREGLAPIEPKHRFTVVRLDDITLRPKTGGIVNGLLYEGDISMNFGETSSAKSFLAIDCGAHVAAGWPWFGRTVKQGGVIYIAAEGAGRIDERFVAFKRYHAERLAEIREPVPFGLIRSDLNLLDPEADLPELIQQINAAAVTFTHPLSLIIIDTQSATLAGGDENRPDVMGSFLANIKRLRRDTGNPHIHLLRHPGKDSSKGDRGHYITRAAIETRIETTKPATEMAGSFRVLKQRDGAAGDTFGFRLEVLEVAYTEEGAPITSCVIVPAEAVDEPGARPKLAKEYQAALDFLWVVVKEAGQRLNRPDYPDFFKAVTVDQWREHLTRRGMYDAGDGGKSRAFFFRLKNKLIAEGLIAFEGNLVWPIR